MRLNLIVAFIALAATAASANAATTTIFAQAGTRGVDFTEAEYHVDSAIGAESGYGFRYLTVTGKVNSVLGLPASPYAGSRGIAYTDATGYQHVALIDTFTSPFFPRADFSADAEIEFRGSSGSLFQGDELLLDTLTRYFIGGTVDYAPGSPTIILALPELGTWMMMIVGLGAIGTVLRRRRGEHAPNERGALTG